MNVSSGQTTTLDLLIAKLNIVMRQGWHDFNIWVSRLSDVEQLFFLGMFILLLFMLILSTAGNRTKKPGNGRQFFGSVVMVMVFAFGAGWMIDSRIELPEIMRMLRLA